MRLNEALQLKKLSYNGTRESYDIHDDNPNVLILDDDYKHDGNGRSILGFNLNYLDGLSASDKRKLVRSVNKVDNKVLDIKGVKTWARTMFNRGDYKGLSKSKKIERYKEIVKEFPELRKVIRRYKYNGISGGKK